MLNNVLRPLRSERLARASDPIFLLPPPLSPTEQTDADFALARDLLELARVARVSHALQGATPAYSPASTSVTWTPSSTPEQHPSSPTNFSVDDVSATPHGVCGALSDAEHEGSVVAGSEQVDLDSFREPVADSSHHSQALHRAVNTALTGTTGGPVHSNSHGPAVVAASNSPAPSQQYPPSMGMYPAYAQGHSHSGGKRGSGSFGRSRSNSAVKHSGSNNNSNIAPKVMPRGPVPVPMAPHHSYGPPPPPPGAGAAQGQQQRYHPYGPPSGYRGGPHGHNSYGGPYMSAQPPMYR